MRDLMSDTDCAAFFRDVRSIESDKIARLCVVDFSFDKFGNMRIYELQPVPGSVIGVEHFRKLTEPYSKIYYIWEGTQWSGFALMRIGYKPVNIIDAEKEFPNVSSIYPWDFDKFAQQEIEDNTLIIGGRTPDSRLLEFCKSAPKRYLTCGVEGREAFSQVVYGSKYLQRLLLSGSGVTPNFVFIERKEDYSADDVSGILHSLHLGASDDLVVIKKDRATRGKGNAFIRASELEAYLNSKQFTHEYGDESVLLIEVAMAEQAKNEGYYNSYRYAANCSVEERFVRVFRNEHQGYNSHDPKKRRHWFTGDEIDFEDQSIKSNLREALEILHTVDYGDLIYQLVVSDDRIKILLGLYFASRVDCEEIIESLKSNTNFMKRVEALSGLEDQRITELCKKFCQVFRIKFVNLLAKELFGLLKVDHQSARIKELISQLHLKGVSIHSLRNGDGVSLLESVASGPEGYEELLLRYEASKNYRMRSSKRETQPSLKKYVIKLTLENGHLLPGFFEHLKANINIEHLIISVKLKSKLKLKAEMIDNLLEALQENTHIKKLTLNSLNLTMNQFNRFAGMTNYRVDLESKYLDPLEQRQLNVRTRFYRFQDEYNVDRFSSHISTVVRLGGKFGMPLSDEDLQTIEEAIDTIQADIFSSFKECVKEIFSRVSVGASALPNLFMPTSGFIFKAPKALALILKINIALQKAKDLPELREKINDFFDMSQEYEEGSIEDELKKVIQAYGPKTLRVVNTAVSSASLFTANNGPRDSNDAANLSEEEPDGSNEFV